MRKTTQPAFDPELAALVRRALAPPRELEGAAALDSDDVVLPAPTLRWNPAGGFLDLHLLLSGRSAERLGAWLLSLPWPPAPASTPRPRRSSGRGSKPGRAPQGRS